MNGKSKQKGMTLIEIMVAITISLILLTGVITLMVSSKRSYNMQTDTARMQENARFVFSFLGKDLRMAGYYGCTGTTPSAPLGLAGTLSAVIGLNDGLNNNGVNKSDILMVTYQDTSDAAFAVDHSAAFGHDLKNTPIVPGTGPFTATQNGLIQPGDIVIASDCGGNEAHVVQSVNSAGQNMSITLNTPLSHAYENRRASFGAQMRPLVARRYFIGPAIDSRDGWSLYRDNPILPNSLPNINAPLIRTVETELVPGVESLQLRFGFDSDGDGVPNQYVIANNVTNWALVTSVKVTMLLVTPERFDIEDNQKIFQLDPESEVKDHKPVDKRRRNVFSATFWLRNNNG